MRLHFPGRLDAEIFYSVHLRRICDIASGAKPSVPEMETAFQTHIQNRSSAAAMGQSPATYKEVLATANTNQLTELASRLQSTEEKLSKLSLR